MLIKEIEEDGSKWKDTYARVEINNIIKMINNFFLEFKHFLSENFVYMYKNPITNIEYYESKTNNNKRQ